MNVHYRRTPTLLAVCTLLTAGALTACTVTYSLSKADMESSTLQYIQSQIPDLEAESVTCPGDLEGKVGLTVTCEVVGTNGTTPVVITVESVIDGKINVDFTFPESAE